MLKDRWSLDIEVHHRQRYAEGKRVVRQTSDFVGVHPLCGSGIQTLDGVVRGLDRFCSFRGLTGRARCRAGRQNAELKAEPGNGRAAKLSTPSRRCSSSFIRQGRTLVGAADSQPVPDCRACPASWVHSRWARRGTSRESASRFHVLPVLADARAPLVSEKGNSGTRVALPIACRDGVLERRRAELLTRPHSTGRDG